MSGKREDDLTSVPTTEESTSDASPSKEADAGGSGGHEPGVAFVPAEEDPSLYGEEYQDPALASPDAGRFAHLDFPGPDDEAVSEEPDAEEPRAQDGAGAADAAPSTPLTGGIDALGEAEAAGEAATTGGEGEEEIREMTFLEHLEELRIRLTRCVVALIVGMLACYNWGEDLFRILMNPMLGALGDSHFIYTYPAEAFFTYMKTAGVAGLFLVSPYLFYQLWSFVAPGLYAHERRWLIPIAFFSAVFFVCGALFGYFIVFPYGFEFFAGFTNDLIQFTPKMDEYFSFALKMLFAFGLIFEMPLFVFFLAVMGLVRASGMRKFRKYMILINFIVAAILTPPDVISQSLMAGPLLVLYEVSILVAALFGKKPKPTPPVEPPVEDDEAGEAA